MNPFDVPPETDPKLIEFHDPENDFHVPQKATKAPPLIGPAAYYGFAGDWVRATEPQSESNRDNLLLQFHIASGVVFGRYFHTTLDRELFPNLFGVILGPSGAGRKGGALYAVKKFLETAAPDWKGARSNWKSGEALIHLTRDPTYKADGKLKDEGIADKRILIEETELIHLFRMGQRDGNTLSATLREAWDSPQRLYNSSKNSSAVSTGAHFGLVGHMTREEFLLVDPGLISNGLINRIAWGNGFQAQKIFDPQPLSWSQALFNRFAEIYLHATGPVDIVIGAPERPLTRFVPLAPEAKERWDQLYRNLPVYPGTLAAVLERYLALTRKFTLNYAILDQSPEIRLPHLEAGIAMAEYSKANAIEVFSGFGPNSNANKLLHALRRNPAAGIEKAGIARRVFNHKLSADDIHEALISLLENDLIEFRGRACFAKIR